MPSGLSEALKLLGFATPLVYAVATYSLFHFLDKRASGPAKKAIGEWVKSLEYDKAAVATAILELFSRLYGRQLFSLVSFGRSTVITVGITAFYLYEVGGLEMMLRDNVEIGRLVIGLAGIVGNIVSDYLSLFVVWWWLRRASVSPIGVLVLGPILGAVLVVAVFSLINFITVHSLVALKFGVQTLVNPRAIMIGLGQYASNWVRLWATPESSLRVYLPPALVVHLWLPLFAVGVLFIQGANLFGRATKAVQWFLKQGQRHPLQAIGCVAAVIVFVGAIVIENIRH